MRSLLDVNVLVARAFPNHPGHQDAHAWFLQEPNRLWATCPLTQAGFLSVATHYLQGAREAIAMAIEALDEDCQSPTHEFWPLDVDFRHLAPSTRARLIGPKQVTDMQLLMLAHGHRGQLVTFDKGMQDLVSGTKYASSLVVL
jgi:toxin-antitoxin system PIN domain toxin